MTNNTQPAEVQVIPAPSLNSVPRDISYVFNSLIRANLPPHAAPATITARRIDVAMKHYGSLSCGTVAGQLEVVGYALDDNTVLFMNVIATTITAREMAKATLDLGADMSLIRTGRNWGQRLYVPRGADGKIKYAYKHHDFNLPVLKARQTVSLIRSIGDETQSHLGRYIMETSLEQAQWALVNIVTSLTGLFVRPEWAQRLWHIAKAGRWIKKCEGEPITFWRVEESADIWRIVIQLCVAERIFEIN